LTWRAWLKAGLDLFKNDAVAVADLVCVWQARAAERHRLRALDDRMLKDIGLSRADAEAEGGKPFWRR